MTTAAAIVSSGSLPLPTSVPMPSTMAAYTAVTPADSRVTSSARLMITSMSNSRRRRIAIAIATGMPKYTRNGVMPYGTVCSGLFSWPNAMARLPTTMVASTPAMARPSHCICWRSRWPPRRYRSASDTSATPSSSGNIRARPLRVPSQVTGWRDRTASGLG